MINEIAIWLLIIALVGFASYKMGRYIGKSIYGND